MSFLNSLTRGNSSLQGKERVYFTCHPEDFDRYFGEITQDIFATQNCAVFYDTDLTAERSPDELEEELSRMQLFVIPITSRFLSEDNRARLVDFEFALAHRIPVLPLMQETGLGDSFNLICGKLQYLEKGAEDSTALPFSDKLESYLNSVLLGDELAQKVRDAFDAYIFLSYRKKDRKYAQQLMQLIHKNEFCRDIAIWYDEFLTPGENFDSAIHAAMSKSELFALVVTPNLVNEQNYIMNIEYPAALEEGKPILPAEMVETDHSELAAKYERIPEPIKADNPGELTDALSAAFSERVKALAIANNDNDPQHLFFIGLAYLGGIDVEVNRERALSLISKAAKAGLAEAIEKLISMYSSGDGVKFDSDAVISWRERLAELRKREYDANPSEEAAKALLTSQLELGRAYQHNYRYSDATDICNRTIELCGRLPGGHADTVKLACLSDIATIERACGRQSEAVAHLRELIKIIGRIKDESRRVKLTANMAAIHDTIGLILCETGNPKAALAEHEAAIRLYDSIINEPDDYEAAIKHNYILLNGHYSITLRSVGNIKQSNQILEKTVAQCQNYGEIYQTLQLKSDIGMLFECRAINYTHVGSHESALEFHSKALAIRRDICNELPSISNTVSVAHSLGNMGTSYDILGKIDEAKAHYEQALEIYKSIAQKAPTIYHRQRLASMHSSLASIGEKLHDNGLFKAHLSAALELCKAIANESEKLNDKLLLAQIYEKLARYHIGSQQLDQAANAAASALEIREKLAAKSNTYQICSALCSSYRQLGDIKRHRGDYAAANEYYHKLYPIAKQLSDQYGTVEAINGYALACSKLALIARVTSDYATALKYYERSARAYEQIITVSAIPVYKTNLANCFNSIAQTYGLMGNRNEEFGHYKRSLDLYLEIKAQTESIASANNVANGYKELGVCLIKHRSYAKAREFMQYARKIYEEVDDKEKSVRSKINVADIYSKLGYLADCEGRKDLALSSFGYSARLYEQVAANNASPAVNRNLTYSYRLMAIAIRDSSKDYNEALGYLKKALDIAQRLAEQTKLASDRLTLSKTYSVMGSVAKQSGDTVASSSYYGKALEIDRALVAQAPTVAHHDHLAFTYLQLADGAQAKGDNDTAARLYLLSAEQRELQAALASTTSARLFAARAYYNAAKLGSGKEYAQKAYGTVCALLEESPENKSCLSLKINLEKLL